MKKLLFILFMTTSPCHAALFTAYSSSCTNNNSIGPNLWVNPANAQGTADGSYATESGTSQYLYCSQFGFNLPTNAIIQGIVAHVWKLSPNLVTDTSVRLFVGGSATGDDKANLLVDWPGTLTDSTYGSGSDTWNINPTSAIVNDPTFGVGIGIQKDGGGTQTGEVDAIGIDILVNVPTQIYNGTIYNGTVR